MLSAVIIFICTCKENAENSVKAEKKTYFDSIENKNMELLNSYNLLQLNDTAKWLLYAIHCDDSCTEGRGRFKQSLVKTPLSFFKMKLNYVAKKSDTLSLLYNFLYDDSLYIERINSDKGITNGIMFDVKNNKIIGYIIGEAIFSQAGNPDSRYVNPLQSEVIAFIKRNKDKLNPWFREEAKRRKIIE